jgi:Flp pilus assembly protein TadD
MDDGVAQEILRLYNKAQGYIGQGNLEQGVAIYRYIIVKYVGKDIEGEEANACFAKVLSACGRDDLAERYIKRAITYNPDNPRYHHMLGIICNSNGQYEKAIEEFALAAHKEPDNVSYLSDLGANIYNHGNRKLGLEHIHKALELAPTNRDLLTSLAMAYLSLGDMTRAQGYAEKAAEIAPDDVWTQVVLRKVLNSRKNL